jgi:hypothetical protein
MEWVNFYYVTATRYYLVEQAFQARKMSCGARWAYCFAGEKNWPPMNADTRRSVQI